MVADSGKLVGSLGAAPCRWRSTPSVGSYLEALAALAASRNSGQTGPTRPPYVTDGGHYTADCASTLYRTRRRLRSRSNASQVPWSAASSSASPGPRSSPEKTGWRLRRLVPPR